MTSPSPEDAQPLGVLDMPNAADAAGAAETLGGWLRRQRQARGWAVPEMTRQLRETAKEVGDPLPEHQALLSMVRRWERGAGVSERYRLHFCRLFRVPAGQYGTGEPVSAGELAGPVTAATSHSAPVVPHMWSYIAPPPQVAYRGVQEPEPCGSWIAREVLMAAHDNSEHAEQAEHREIGDATLEQFRADVIQLSRDSMTGEPLSLLMEMRRVRERMHAALDRRLWPRDEAEIYLLLGCLCDLTAVAADSLGCTPAAEELIRAGWAYATVIDHGPLKAHLRLQLASICHWADQPHRVLDLATDGLRYLTDGPIAAHLHVKYAQAAARTGDEDGARRAIGAATEARDREPADDLLDIGGEFRLSMATQHYVAGSALAELNSALDDAARELDEAADSYAAGPDPGEQHWFGGRALADVERATVRLRSGALDGAVVVLDPVLSLPRGQRITAVTIQLGRTRRELAAPVYRGSAEARELSERIEDFCRQTIVADLHSLPGG